MKINRNLYPPNGYTFTDRDGHRHRAGSWKSLERLVREYRALNAQDPGNPEEEINAFHCAQTPQFCQGVVRQPPASSRKSETDDIPRKGLPNLNLRVLAWLTERLNLFRAKKQVRVSDAEAARRAEICRRCPRQRALSEACHTCLSGVRQARKVLLKGGANSHQNLLCCKTLSEDCQVSVYLEQPPIASAELPAGCWRKA